MTSTACYRSDIGDSSQLGRRRDRVETAGQRCAPDPDGAIRLDGRSKAVARGYSFHIRQSKSLHSARTRQGGSAITELAAEVVSPTPNRAVGFQRQYKTIRIFNAIHSVDALYL